MFQRDDEGPKTTSDCIDDTRKDDNSTKSFSFYLKKKLPCKRKKQVQTEFFQDIRYVRSQLVVWTAVTIACRCYGDTV